MTWSRIILFSKDEESRFRTCSMWHAPIAKLFSLNILQKPSVNKTIDVKTISKSLKQCVTVSWVILNDSFSFWVFLVRTFGDYITHLLSRPCTDQEETFDQNFERRYRWYEIRVNIWLICFPVTPSGKIIRVIFVTVYNVYLAVRWIMISCLKHSCAI